MDGLNVSFVEETLILLLVPEVTSSNIGYLVAFVLVSSDTVILPPAVAQVWSPLRYVVAFAVPDANLAVGTVPEPRFDAFRDVRDAPEPLNVEALKVLELALKLNAVAVLLALAVWLLPVSPTITGYKVVVAVSSVAKIVVEGPDAPPVPWSP